MKANAPNVNRRKFLRQSVAFMATGAGALASPAGFLSLTYLTKAALLGEQASAQSPSSSPSTQEEARLARGLLYPQQNQVRNVLDISGLWQFQLDPKEEGEAQGWFKALPAPRPIPVPCSWNDLFDDARDYLGLAWYLARGVRPVGLARAARVPAHRLGELRREGVGQRHGRGRASRRAPAVRRRRHRPAGVGRNERHRHRGREQATAGARAAGPGPGGGGVAGVLGGFPATTYDFFPYAGLHRPVRALLGPGRRAHRRRHGRHDDRRQGWRRQGHGGDRRRVCRQGQGPAE